MPTPQPVGEDRAIKQTVKVLGGRKFFDHPVHSRLEAHDVIERGFRAGVIDHLIKQLVFLYSQHNLAKALGISERTYQRYRAQPQKRLSAEQSSRAWKFAEIMSRATEVFGSQKEAEEWMERPAMALDQRKPIDLLSTPAGVETVEEHLTRLEFGVYT